MPTGLGVGSTVACYEFICRMAQIAAESQPPTLSVCLRSQGDLWVCWFFCLSLSLPYCFFFCSQLYFSVGTPFIWDPFYAHSLSISAFFALPTPSPTLLLFPPVFSPSSCVCTFETVSSLWSALWWFCAPVFLHPQEKYITMLVGRFELQSYVNYSHICQGQGWNLFLFY